MSTATTPKVYRLVCDGWKPALLNELMAGGHWSHAHKLKTRDANQIATAMLVFGVPRARQPRRVSVEITGRFGRFPDDDSVAKSLLDGLTRAGAIVDDSRTWCEFTRPTWKRGPTCTVITLEEML